MSTASSSSASEGEVESEAETKNFVDITLDWLAIPRNKTRLRGAITNEIYATPQFEDDPNRGREDLDGATEIDSAESRLDRKSTNQRSIPCRQRS